MQENKLQFSCIPFCIMIKSKKKIEYVSYVHIWQFAIFSRVYIMIGNRIERVFLDFVCVIVISDMK